MFKYYKNDKEFERDKAIEEMKTHIKSALSGVLEIEIDKLAEELLKHYQPKIPENTVVLTREELENLQEKIRILEVQLDLEQTRTLEEWLKITRKKTAKKIANNIEDILQLPYKGKTEKQEYKRKGMTEGLRMALEICEEVMEKEENEDSISSTERKEN